MTYKLEAGGAGISRRFEKKEVIENARAIPGGVMLRSSLVHFVLPHLIRKELESGGGGNRNVAAY